MSSKKRKRELHGVRESNGEPTPQSQTPDKVKVSILQDAQYWQPVFASTPGVTLPKSLSFQPYRGGEGLPSRLLLHSDTHPTLDYVAEDEVLPLLAQKEAHYIGVFDPQSSELELVPARKMIIRTHLKTSRPEAVSPEPVTYALPKMSSRADLNQAFGTKKSQKLLKETVSGAIGASKTLAQGQATSAFIESIPLDQVNKETLQAESIEKRPIPVPNISAQLPEEVYPVLKLIGGDDMFAKMRVKRWMDTFDSDDEVFRSLFVARRFKPLCKQADVTPVKALRFLYALILFHKSLRSGKGRDSQMLVPNTETIPPLKEQNDHNAPSSFAATLLEDFGKDIFLTLAKRFSESGKLTRWHNERLITHILAVTLHIDNFETNMHHIRSDLRLELKKCTQLYKELGCECKPLTKAESEKLGVSREAARDMRVAKLKVPLQLPKVRTPVMKRKN